MSNQRELIPLNIAVLTVSDTRGEAEDKSGALLIARLNEAVPHARRTAHRQGRHLCDPCTDFALDSGSRCECSAQHGRHWGHRSRRHTGGSRAFARQANRRLRGSLSHAVLPRTSKPPPFNRERWQVSQTRPISSACPGRQVHAGTLGIRSSVPSSITARAHVTWLN